MAYFLPMGLSSAGMFFYIHTNHFACQMTEINDPLINSISIKIPKFFDILHLNFSYHTEHHIFPSLNSDYYPMVRELLKIHFPERMGYLMTAQEAWHLLMTTPRLYKDETTFTDWPGSTRPPSASCECPGLPRSR